MEKLFINALNDSIKEGKVFGTNLENGVVINEVKLNTNIAQSIRTLYDVDSFGKGEVSITISFIPTNFEGYIFQKDDVIIFLEYVERSKEIERIVINKEEGDYPSHYLLQAILLLELLHDKSGMNLREKVLETLNLPFIKEGTDEADQFANVVRMVENMISEGLFDPYDETEVQDEMDIVHTADSLVRIGIDRTAKPVILEEEPVEAAVEEIIETPLPVVSEDVTPEEKREEAIEAKTETAQITLFHENEELDAEAVATLVEQALKMGHRPDVIAKAADVVPSTIYGIKDVETLRKYGKNPRQTTLNKIVNAIRSLGDVEPENAPTTIVAEENEVKEETIVTPSPSTPSNRTGVLSNATIETIVESAVTKAVQSLAHVLQGPAPATTSKAEEKPAFDMAKAKEIRPNVFDDTWVRTKLKGFEIEDQDIDDVIKFRKEKREELLRLNPESLLDIEPDFFYEGYTEPVETAIDAVLEDLNLLFKGEAGSGKTTLIQSVSCLFNLPLYTINGSDESNIETIVGFKELDGRSIIFKEGRLVKAMRVGGIFYSDEANMIRPNILAIINGALDHRRELYNEFVGERIKANKGFRFMAAINEEYEDTRAMNRATLDRSIAFEMTYMTIEQLKVMLRKLDPDMGERDIRMLAQIATALQQAVRDETISPEVASVRNIIYLQKMARRRTFEKALKRIIDKYPREDRASIIGVLSSVDRLNITAEEIITS